MITAIIALLIRYITSKYAGVNVLTDFYNIITYLYGFGIPFTAKWIKDLVYQIMPERQIVLFQDKAEGGANPDKDKAEGGSKADYTDIFIGRDGKH